MLLESRIRDLVHAIKQTTEFAEFNKAKTNLDKYKNLKDEMKEFEKKQMELYKMDMQSREGRSLALEINKSFKNLSKYSEVHDLLNSAKVFNDMMFKVYKSIQDSLDSEFNK
ncbi:MAG: YlbF family regulator [Maledivibacter sp.]|jgi:cell fate (sporulation/competence/biofilm development) regulator YlbF (YheA/YmcA/DUF963 family)|nr:YlbF family regulator [Maledivibacter sp.]